MKNPESGVDQCSYLNIESALREAKATMEVFELNDSDFSELTHSNEDEFSELTD